MPRTTRRAAVLAAALVALGAGAGSLAAEPLKLRTAPPVYGDPDKAGLREPEGVAIDAARGRLVVADAGNGRLAFFRVTADGVAFDREARLRELPYPVRVQLTRAGEILALDGKSRRVVRVGVDGAFRGFLDPAPLEGRAVVRSFAVDSSDRVYLLDVGARRLVVAGADGKVQREVPFPPGHGFLSDVAVGPGGAVFLLDSVGRRVYALAPGAKAAQPLGPALTEDLAFPVALAPDGRGNLLISDQNGGGIVILGQDGSFRGRQSAAGWGAGLLRYPAQIAVTDAGTVYVADRGNNRVQVFTIAR